MNLHVGKEAYGFDENVGGFVNGLGGKKAFFPFNQEIFQLLFMKLDIG